MQLHIALSAGKKKKKEAIHATLLLVWLGQSILLGFLLCFLLDIKVCPLVCSKSKLLHAVLL